MKSFIAIIGGLLLILMSVFAITGTNSFRAKDYTATYGGVTESSGSAIITLTQPLWQEDTSALSLASDEAGDHPLATGYSRQNQNLTIIGLDSTATRTITITYSISNLKNYPIADPLSMWVPVFFILAGLALITGGAVSAFRK